MIEEQEIFSSYIFLKFQNKNVQSQYDFRNLGKIIKFNKISFALISLLALAIDIILLVKKYPKGIDSISRTKLFSYILIISSISLTLFGIALFHGSFLRPFHEHERSKLHCQQR